MRVNTTYDNPKKTGRGSPAPPEFPCFGRFTISAEDHYEVG